MPCNGEYLRIHGVNRNGSFGNQLNALGFTRARFAFDEDSVPLYSLVDCFLAGKSGLDFSPTDALAVLNAVKQIRYTPYLEAALYIPDF